MRKIIIGKDQKLMKARAWVRILANGTEHDHVIRLALGEMVNPEGYYHFDLKNEPARIHALVEFVVEHCKVHGNEIPTSQLTEAVRKMHIYGNWERTTLAFIEEETSKQAVA